MWCFAYEFSIYVLITISGIIIFDMNNISDVLNLIQAHKHTHKKKTHQY